MSTIATRQDCLSPDLTAGTPTYQRPSERGLLLRSYRTTEQPFPVHLHFTAEADGTLSWSYRDEPGFTELHLTAGESTCLRGNVEGWKWSGDAPWVANPDATRHAQDQG